MDQMRDRMVLLKAATITNTITPTDMETTVRKTEGEKYWKSNLKLTHEL